MYSERDAYIFISVCLHLLRAFSSQIITYCTCKQAHKGQRPLHGYWDLQNYKLSPQLQAVKAKYCCQIE